MSKKKEKPCFMEDIYLKHERLMYYIAGKYSEVSAQREDIVQTAVMKHARRIWMLIRFSGWKTILILI